MVQFLLQKKSLARIEKRILQCSKIGQAKDGYWFVPSVNSSRHSNSCVRVGVQLSRPNKSSGSPIQRKHVAARVNSDQQVVACNSGCCPAYNCWNVVQAACDFGQVRLPQHGASRCRCSVHEPVPAGNIHDIVDYTRGRCYI